jgi:hypothetical protein
MSVLMCGCVCIDFVKCVFCKPLHEFIEAVETAADVGRWSNEDKVRIETQKLTDATKAFYNKTPELHISSTVVLVV